jgi:diacylglycerol kinase (ATP)
MKTCLILNPNAGSAGDVRQALDEVLDGRDGVVVRETAEAGDAGRIAREAIDEGFGRVVAAGGDGTLNEVLNGIAPRFDAVELGLVPLGTGNDLSRKLAIPREMPGDLHEAIELAVEGAARPLDVASVRTEGGEPHYFINMSAGGFSGEVDDKMEAEVKAAWGPLSYVRGAFGALSELELYRARIVLDPGTGDEEEIRLATVNVVVANACFVGGGLHVAPTAEPDDGLLDLVVIQAAPIARLSLLAPQVLVGNHLEDELVLHRRARRLTIRSEPPMPFNADGEPIGETPVTYEVLPGAVRFVTPPLPLGA